MVKRIQKTTAWLLLAAVLLSGPVWAGDTGGSAEAPTQTEISTPEAPPAEEAEPAEEIPPEEPEEEAPLELPARAPAAQEPEAPLPEDEPAAPAPEETLMVLPEADSEAEDADAMAAQQERETPAQQLGYQPGEVVVVFNEGVQPQAAEQALEKLGALDEEATGDMDGTVVATATIAEDQTVAQAITTYESDPAVAYAEPNYLYTLAEAETVYEEQGMLNDPLLGGATDEQWYFEYLSFDKTWEMLDTALPASTPRVKVAVIDSPSDNTHEDLQSNVRWDLAVDYSASVQAPWGSVLAPDHHGTHVTGVIGATAGNGVGIAGVAADYVEIIPVNVFYINEGGQCVATLDSLVYALEYVRQQGAQVVSMSLGGTQNSKALQDKVTALKNDGIVCVVASGNDNNTEKNYPSDYDDAISVINATRGATPAESTRYATSNYGSEKDISAPGVGLLSCGAGAGSYVSMTGTSMATPVVAGAAALLKYVDPAFTFDNVYDFLTKTATPMSGQIGHSDQTGHGLVNPYAAVRKALKDKFGTFEPAVGELLMMKNETRQIDVVYDESIANNQPQSFVSGNPAVATVNGQGVVTAVGAGSATITVKNVAGTNEASVMVYVAPFPQTAPQGLYCEAGATCDVRLSWQGFGGGTRYVVYRGLSANTLQKIAEVNTPLYEDSGLVTGKSYTYAVLPVVTLNGTEFYGKRSAAATWKKTAAPPPAVKPPAGTAPDTGQPDTAYVSTTRLVPNMAAKYLEKGKSVQLKVTVEPQNASDREVVWSTSNKSVAKVSQTGKVKGLKNGNATITAKAGGKSVRFRIRVGGACTPVKKVKMEKKITLPLKGKAKLHVTVLPEKASSRKVTYTSSAPEVVAVSPAGRLTAKAAGKAIITAKTAEGGKTCRCTVTVK